MPTAAPRFHLMLGSPRGTDISPPGYQAARRFVMEKQGHVTYNRKGLSDNSSERLLLRAAEWIQVVFVSILALAAGLRPLERARRVRVTVLALVAIAAIAAAWFSSHWVPPLTSSIIRDWLPAALLLVPYWQAGQFFAEADPATQQRLANFDRA